MLGVGIFRQVEVTMTSKSSVVVIGAGLAGLTSALILARNGRKVTLIEKSTRIGLTVRGFSRQGVYFDTGLHYTGGLGEGGIVRRYMKYLGMDDLKTVAFSGNCFDEIRFADTGRIVRLPVGYEPMVNALCEAFPEEREAIIGYMGAARADFGNSSLLSFFLDAQKGVQASGVRTSLTQYLNGITQNEYLRTSLSIHALLYGVSPDEISFTQHAYVTASYFDSAHNFAGGGRTLIEAFERRLREEGVTVVLGNGVRRIVCDKGNRLTSLLLEDGTEVLADACISTTHPAVLAEMATDAFRPSYVEYLRGLEDTVTAYMLFGIADEKPAPLRGNNLYLCRDPHMIQAFAADAVPEHGPFYIATCPQPEDATKWGVVVVAPGTFEGVSPWLDSRHGARPKEYKEFKANIVQRIQDAIVSMCPELATVRFVDSASPLTMRDYLSAPHGGLYGCKHSIHQFNPLPFTRIPNLWLAGQSVIAPGLMGAMISAFLACGFLVGHSTLQKEIS